MPQQNALYRLLEIARLLNSTQNERQVLAEILKAIRYVMEAEASSLLMLDKDSGELFFDAVQGGSDGVREIRLKLGEGIAGWVAQKGKLLAINDVKRDRRFTGRVDKATGFVTRNILCAPLETDGKIIGVVQAINKKRGSFSKEDQKIFSAFAAQAAIALNNARLYSLAFVDALTQMYGRRYFDVWLEKEFARAQRYGTNFALLLIDIDFFKRVNDQFSHLAGDAVLAQTATVIKAAVRASDIPARYGGEEFIVILTETGQPEASMVAERVRGNIQDHKYVFANQTHAITASLGLAEFSLVKPKSAPELVRAADDALYKAKESGRNRVAQAQSAAAAGAESKAS